MKIKFLLLLISLNCFQVASVHAMHKGDAVQDSIDLYLFYAIKLLGIDDVAECLKKKPDLNREDEYGNRPLHWAVYVERADMVGLLILKGAELSSMNKVGKTPLEAARQENPEYVKFHTPRSGPHLKKQRDFIVGHLFSAAQKK